MSVAIGLEFLAGRYHATPWGKHVNEGAVEWPPSPWRILRSLVAIWKLRMSPADDAMPNVLAKLCDPPEYCLPPVALGHTRHYMPLFKGERTLVFDAFAAVCRDVEMTVIWRGIELTNNEREALCEALQAMNYLGRSESWCAGRLLSNEEATNLEPNCAPLSSGSFDGRMESLRLMVPDPKAAVLPGINPERWPLCAGTADLRKQKWSDPPGSKWITYLRPADCFAVTTATQKRESLQIFRAARFNLDGPVLPLVTETVSLGEFARVRLQGIYGKQNEGSASEVLSGKSPDGERLQGHRHAFFLPSDENGDGKIEQLILFAKDGFGRLELKAMDRFRVLRQVGNKPDLQVTLTGLGDLGDFSATKILKQSKVWRSTTPFVPMRHEKVRRGVSLDGPEDQLRLEVKRRGLPAEFTIRRLERDEKQRRWIEYRLQRLTGDGRHGSLMGYGFELEFSTAVDGPLALGYGCHFGLGLFKAVG